MARPKKPKHEQRCIVAKTNLTPEEDLKVAMSVAASGLSRAEYQRRRLLGLSVTPPPAKADARLIAELNDLGNNVNQIARDVNSGREYRGDWPAALARLNDLFDRLLLVYDL
jgi:hypothetical protein